MRRSGSGGTGLARCSLPRSARSESRTCADRAAERRTGWMPTGQSAGNARSSAYRSMLSRKRTAQCPGTRCGSTPTSGPRALDQLRSHGLVRGWERDQRIGNDAEVPRRNRPGFLLVALPIYADGAGCSSGLLRAGPGSASSWAASLIPVSRRQVRYRAPSKTIETPHRERWIGSRKSGRYARLTTCPSQRRPSNPRSRIRSSLRLFQAQSASINSGRTSTAAAVRSPHRFGRT